MDQEAAKRHAHTCHPPLAHPRAPRIALVALRSHHNQQAKAEAAADSLHRHRGADDNTERVEGGGGGDLRASASVGRAGARIDQTDCGLAGWLAASIKTCRLLLPAACLHRSTVYATLLWGRDPDSDVRPLRPACPHPSSLRRRRGVCAKQGTSSNAASSQCSAVLSCLPTCSVLHGSNSAGPARLASPLPFALVFPA